MNAKLKTDTQEIDFGFEIVNGVIIWLRYKYANSEHIYSAKNRTLKVDKDGYYFIFYKNKVRVEF